MKRVQAVVVLEVFKDKPVTASFQRQR
jgi:hypothetical protein